MTDFGERDRYLTLLDLARYSTFSVRTLKRMIADPVRPLPAYRVRGRTLVRQSDFDRWVEQQESDPTASNVISGRNLTREERAAYALRGWVVQD